MTTVFFDVDTQLDFMFPSGALYVPGAETIVERVAALNRDSVGSGGDEARVQPQFVFV